MTVVKDQLESIQKTIKTSIKENLTEAIDDKKEIDKRKMNLVVFGMNEVVDSENSWSTTEKINKDIEDITEIIKNELGVGISPRNGIIDARRLGMKKSDKPRPLKIEFKDIQTKRDVLTNARKLRDSENPQAKNMYINPDLSEKQRELDSALRAKMWTMRGEGQNVIIRKGAIVTADHVVRKTRSPKPSTSKTNKQ